MIPHAKGLSADASALLLRIMAALAAPENAEAALTIAMVHLLFNLAGILIWYVPSYTRTVPLKLATKFAGFAAQSKRWAIIYVCLAFYALPAAIFFIAEAFTKG